MELLRRFQLGEYSTEVHFFDKDKIAENPNSLYVMDSNTRGLIAPLGNHLVLPAGEQHKNWESVSAILRKALETGLDRQAVITGIGGGVVCDMTAFAASLFMRGPSG